MSPTISFLLCLTALIPQAFSASIPAKPALNLISLPSGPNPLPPLPPPAERSYKIPGTTLSIRPGQPLGPSLPSPALALACIASAQTDVAHAIATHGDIQIPRPAGWHFSTGGVRLGATAPFPKLGTYSQLAAGLRGLRHLLTAPVGPGMRAFEAALFEEGLGAVMAIGISVDEGRRELLGGGNGKGNGTEGAKGTGTGTGTASGIEAEVSVVAWREYQ